MTVQEAAKILGVGERYVRALCELGKIKAVKKSSGKRGPKPWVINKSSFNAFVRKGEPSQGRKRGKART